MHTDSNEASSEESSARWPELSSEQIGGDRGESREERREEDADFADVYRYVEQVEQPVNGARREHQPWVHGASNNAPQWIPRSVIEPVQKRIEPVLRHVLCCAVVEPGIELVDYTLEAIDTQTERQRDNKNSLAENETIDIWQF